MNIFDLPIKVDRFGGSAELFVLSHFHRDHMSGMEMGWNKGPLLCSRITANLLATLESVPEANLCVIEPDESREFGIDGRNVRITAFEANHCPGALMFMFETGERKIVYSGDFRLDDHLRELVPQMAGADKLYIDATYASPDYTFPTQDESVAMVLDAVRENMEKEILLAIYTIGKTKIVEALYNEFGRPVFVSKDKLKAYKAMGYGECVTGERKHAGFIGYSRAYFDSYFRWNASRNPSNALVIYPSGMCLDMNRRPGFYYVPYSEHCDWTEFCEFVSLMKAKEVVKI